MNFGLALAGIFHMKMGLFHGAIQKDGKIQ